MTRQDEIIAFIHHAVPALVGAFLAFLIGRIPGVAAWIATADSTLAALGLAGVSVTVVLQTLAVAGTILAYYWVARQVSKRWPASEKWLLGRTGKPSYGSQPIAGIPGLTLVSGAPTGPQNVPAAPQKYGS